MSGYNAFSFSVIFEVSTVASSPSRTLRATITVRKPSYSYEHVESITVLSFSFRSTPVFTMLRFITS